MPASLHVGDKVVHKSGGPIWIVIEVRESEIICERVDTAGQVHKQAFLAAVLVRHEPPKPFTPTAVSDPRRGF